MFRTVELPLWLLVLILLFAAVTFLSHFLFPSVRWFFRRRMERAVAELNKRLQRPIEPFKLARRHDTIQRIVYDRSVLEAVTEHAREEGVPETVALERARRYAREIVPSFSAMLYFSFATRAARWLSEKLYTVRVDEESGQAIREIDPEATVIFVMNHRSNMDYVLVTYLTAERSALSYAVGEWARVWPLSWLIRSIGGYFIRRKSRNALYRRVLARYVQMATDGGVTQGMFPEGGLSLDGRMAQPKLGLLSYILAEFNPEEGRDVVFVPVALNYDRVIEDRVLTEAAASGERRFRASVLQSIWFPIRYAWRRWRKKAVRFGQAGVRFGEPMSLRAYSEDHVHVEVKGVARELLARVQAAIPVLPVPLIAWLVLRAGGAVSRAELERQVAGIQQHRQSSLMGQDAAAIVDTGIAGLTTRRVLVEGPEGVSLAPGQDALAAYYANSVAHHFKAEPPEIPAKENFATT
ncbi:1-acyl-sn-glycerol-3-phosphate acyltransferase [Pseudoruegeria sp. HB172150]|uniref:1-acyl-sn-glycerol-3-phosphate acyltransferase n=1 Tax=Pseudoruegeria sp. HB172150 TaxID=2721164 RepID=UPI0015575987|nr:1-acyl-sn-glycerol-3-phosphate acyltransferase [Pseudoruegeria sp. HB172150]